MIPKKISKHKLLLLIGDSIIIIFSLNLAFILRLRISIINFLDLEHGVITILLMLIFYLTCFYIFDLYNTTEKFRSVRFIANEIASLILISFFAIIFFYIFPFKVGRGVFLIDLALTGIFVAFWRVSYSSFFRSAIPKKNVLIAGEGKFTANIYSLLKENPDYKVIGIISDSLKKNNFPELNILGNTLSLKKIVNDFRINDIVVTREAARNNSLNRELIKFKMSGVNIWEMPTFYEYLMRKLPVQYIKDIWFIYSGGFTKLGSKIYNRLKRIIDLIISLIILFLSFPILIIISLAIKLSSKGPILFIQDRVGENYKLFKLFKFRTMISDAEKKGEPLWAEENDIRVTRLGKILRKTRLDELPQLINVIKGEMSLIGPRPEREYFIKKLMDKIPFYSLRFLVKPGITGWAQVNYPYGASEKEALEKLQYDLYHIKNMSLFLDLRILLKTVKTIIFGMGR